VPQVFKYQVEMATTIEVDEVKVPLVANEQSNTLNEPLDGELDGELNRLASNAKLSLKDFNVKQLYTVQWKNMRSWGSFIDTNRMKVSVQDPFVLFALLFFTLR
jgi:hypothetical protein